MTNVAGRAMHRMRTLLAAVVAVFALSGLAILPTQQVYAQAACYSDRAPGSSNYPTTITPILEGINTFFVSSTDLNAYLHNPLLSPNPMNVGIVSETTGLHTMDGDFAAATFSVPGTGQLGIRVVDLRTFESTTLLPPSGSSYIFPVIKGNNLLFQWIRDFDGVARTDLLNLDIAKGVVYTMTNFNGSATIHHESYSNLQYDVNGSNYVYTYSVTGVGLPQVALLNQAGTVQMSVPSVAKEFNPHVNATHVAFNGEVNGESATYLYDIATQTTATIWEPSFEAEPGYQSGIFDMSDTHLLYYTWHAGLMIENLYLYELSTGITIPLGANFDLLAGFALPKIAGDYVTWSQNDAFTPSRNGHTTDAMPVQANLSAIQNNEARTNFDANIKRYQISTGEVFTVNRTEDIYPYSLTEEGRIGYTAASVGGSQAGMLNCDTDIQEFFLMGPVNNTDFSGQDQITNFQWTAAPQALTYKFELFRVSSNTRLATVYSYLLNASAHCENGLCTLSVVAGDLWNELEYGQYVWNVNGYNFIDERGATNGVYQFWINANPDPELVNLVQNSSFELPLATGWKAKNSAKVQCNTPEKTLTVYGNCALQLRNIANVRQTLSTEGISTLLVGDQLRLTGNGGATGSTRIKLIVPHTNGTTRDAMTVKLSPGNMNSFDKTLLITDTPNEEAIKLIISNRSGRALIDNLRVNLEAYTLKADTPEVLPLPEAPSSFRN